MTRKGAKPKTQDVEPLDLTEIYSAEDLSPALESLKSELGIAGDMVSYVIVHKVQADTGKEARVWKGTPDAYDLDALAKRFGSGDYIVRLYVQSERGNFACRGSKEFPVLLDAAEDARIVAGRNPGALIATPQVDVGAAISAALAVQNDKMMTLLLPLLTGAQGNRQNAIAELKGLAEVIGMGRAAPVTDANDPMKLFGMFQKFMELSKTLAPEKGLTEDEIGPNALMMKGLDMFMQAMQDKKAAQAAGVPLAQIPSGAAVSLPPMPTMPAPETGEDDEMKIALLLLMSAAKKNADIEKYAVMVYEDAGDEVIAALEKPDWFAVLSGIAPECATYQTWFTKVRDRVITLLQEDLKGDNVVNDAEPPPG